MPLLELKNLTARFDSLIALDDLNLSVEEGEFLSLLGPSGCGKTTTIRLIAGFLSPSTGRILLEGRDITELPPEKRKMGIVFQTYALFPHFNVFENVAFGLRARGTSRPQMDEKVRRALGLADLAGYEKRLIFELSGGEQQRVAIARAIVIEPQVLLLDEPLSNLDAALRQSTRRQLRELTKSLGITSIFVTHDQEEAFVLSDRIVLLSKGVCQQVGTSEELYYRPRNEVVARFIGRSNILEISCREIRQEHAIFTLPNGGEFRVNRPDRFELRGGEKYKVLLRPEAIRPEPLPGDLLLGSGQILHSQFSGSLIEYEVEWGGLRLALIETSREQFKTRPQGARISLHCAAEAPVILP
jgi:ABC-type Fe3+/spermidine/putrescine transport system ATPase subunit